MLAKKALTHFDEPVNAEKVSIHDIVFAEHCAQVQLYY
jgi:hypothetical protein